MKNTGLSVFVLALFFSCTPQKDTAPLEEKIKMLETRIENSYSPGLGDLMLTMQVRHSKLWFAGSNSNWKLADFQVEEIEECLEDIQKFNGHKPEAEAIGMIRPPLDSISRSIKNKDLRAFKNSFLFLTNTCNNCHKATHHEYNVITLPEETPFSNQNFKPAQ